MKKTLPIIVFLLISWGLRGQFVADFTSNKTFGCAPLIVKLTDASTPGANKWTWTSTAGVSSDIQNPTLVFATPGVFDITLVSSNGIETKDTTISVRVTPGITVDFSTSDTAGCVPFTTQLSDLSVPQSSAIKSWFWSFSNGTTSTEQNPSVTFQDAGKYNVLLKITDNNGCEASFTKTNFITAGGPIADFSYDSMACQIPATVNFINLSKGENLTYEWNFGNGNAVNTEIASPQIYNAFDTVPVTLYVKENNTSCTDSVEKLMYIRDYQAKMDVTAVCNGLDFSLTLKDQTTPKPTSILWDLGDGSQNVNSEFTHTYASNAPRTITLTSKIGSSCVNIQTLDYSPPKASFSLSVKNTCESPSNVTFSNLSTGIGLTHVWTYGDSSAVDTVFENSHGYLVPPILFVPKLSIVDTFGCVSDKSQFILVPIPIADFTTENEKTKGCAPLTVDFADLTKKVLSPIQDITWSYGDPNSGILNTGKDSLSSHTFNEPGKYDITLIVTLENGCSDTIVKKEYILVGELPATADFNILFKDTICYGESLNFEGLATYTNPTFFADYFCWAFEEDQSSLLLNSDTPPIECPEGPTNFLPTDTFVHSQISTHQYSNYAYKNGSSKSGYNYLGEIVPVDSTLHTHLIVGFNGCYDEVIKDIHVTPTSAMIGFAFDDTTFNLVGCDTSKTIGIYNASVEYDSLLYFRIVYEPTLDTVKNIAEKDTAFYTFNKPGDYSIQIGVFNKVTKCQNEVSKTFHVIDKTLKIKLPLNSCWNKEVIAIDESTFSKGALSERTWLLQGAIDNSSFFPTVINDTLWKEVVDTGWNVYSLALSLRVPDDIFGPQSPDIECPYIYSDSLYVEGSVVKIKLDTNITCGGDSVLFTNESIGTSGFQSIEWHLKDSTKILSTTDSFKIAYDTPKSYIHSLIVNNTFGCRDTVDASPLLVSIPTLKFEANDTVICTGESVTFTNSSVGNDLSHTWTIESTNYFNIDAAHTFFKVDTLDVKLHAFDKYGCEDSTTYQQYVRVAEVPTSQFKALDIDVNCPPFTIQFLNTSNTLSTEWLWNISDGGNQTTENFLHTFVTAGKFDVEFTSTNKDGCTNTLKKTDYITVRGPSASVTTNKTEICSPDSVKFMMDMNDVAYYIWDYNDGTVESNALTSNLDTVTHTYSKSGLINPIFTVIDNNDCAVVIPNIPTIAVDSLNPSIEASQLINCSLDSVRFINNASSHFPSTFTWDFGDGNTSTDSLGVNKYSAAGTYDIKLMMKSSIGCLDTGKLKHTIHLGPGQELSVTNKYFCVPTNTTLKLNYGNPSFTPEEVFFKLDNDKIIGDSIVLPFANAKSYNMSYQITYGAGNCVVDSHFVHEYFELPVAEFDFNPKHLSLQIPQIFFTNNSVNSTIWNWSFGDGNTKTLENPAHSYIEANKYSVQLIASNEGGCTDTTVVQIPVAPDDVIQLPNAFTPDGDGFNDEFGILYAGHMDILSFKVFNRWGNLVFRTGDITEKWDGQYKGEPQNHGTYVYYVKGRNEDGKILEYKGNFSLIR